MLPVMLKRRQRSGWPMLPIPAPKLVPPSHTRTCCCDGRHLAWLGTDAASNTLSSASSSIHP